MKTSFSTFVTRLTDSISIEESDKGVVLRVLSADEVIIWVNAKV